MDTASKIQALIAAYEERNRAMHIIRDRIQKTCIWVLGIFLAVSGWIIQGNIALTLIQKIFCGLIVIIATLTIRFLYLRDIEKGFKGQQRSLVRIETALHFFKPGFYDNEDIGLFPKKWKESGTQNGNGRYIQNNYIMLYIGAIVLLIALTAQGWIF